MGMANGTTFYTAISTLLDRNDFCRAHSTIEGIIPWSLKTAMGASNFHLEAYVELITKLISLEDVSGAWMLFAKHRLLRADAGQDSVRRDAADNQEGDAGRAPRP